MIHPSWHAYPSLLEDLDTSKNRNLTFKGKPVKATDLTVGTNKKLDWRCSACEHQWSAAGYQRLAGSGCPACANQAVHSDGRNSMANTHPELAKEYQGDATTVIAGTDKKLPWRCSACEHQWSAQGSTRVAGQGCPACANQAIHSDGRNSMANTHPELAKEYQGDATTVIAGTDKKLPWRCSACEHQWSAQGSTRVAGQGCPACANQAIHSDGRNSMANTHPELAKEYQGDATTVIAGTDKKLPWRCSACEHQWSAQGSTRVAGQGCPACANQAIHSDGRNSMANTHPELAKEYQGDATTVIAGTDKKLPWRCSACEHQWSAQGSTRVAGQGCPACANQAIHSDGRNSMANTHPELAKEYQGDATTVIAGTDKKLPWRCSACEHQWSAQGSNRVKGNGCPACAEYGYDSSRIGYLYIHHYYDGIQDWLKCGITNRPKGRILDLRKSASKFSIEITEIDIFRFDDGKIPVNCEKELLDLKEIRYDSGYDIDGRTEFFKFEALEIIRESIEKWR